MIRFRRLFDLDSEPARRRIGELKALFRDAFPAEAEAAERIERLIEGSGRLDYEPIVLIAENQRGQVLGLDVTLYFHELALGYLYYIASDPRRAARGIGGALYEAMRELLRAKGARGLLFDVGPDDPAKLKDPSAAATNRKRLAFYARYGARPVVGTDYELLPNPRNDGYRTLLLYDPLGRHRPLRRAEARRFVRRMFAAQYGFAADDPYLRAVAASFRDDPVRLRPPAAAAREAAPTGAATRGPWLRPIKVVAPPRHEMHHVHERGYVERPVRVRQVLRGLDGLPIETRPLRRYGEAYIRAVHDPRMVAFLSQMSARLGPRELIYPEVFPVRRPDRRPRTLEAQVGYWCIDTFTPLSRTTYAAARDAADCALTAADLLRAGERYVYAICRPPGHHAERALYGGFCYFNNAAIAAHVLAADGKVAVLDIDYHHGNGTQAIFYGRGDVFTCSIHGAPAYAYPHFAGYADERGDGDGRGANRNYPLNPGIGDDRYLEVLGEALAQIRRFRPRWLVLSLGFDVMRGDPTGTFLVTVAGMRRIGAAIARVNLPTLVVQEGGYALWNLRHGARAFFQGLGSGWY